MRYFLAATAATPLLLFACEARASSLLFGLNCDPNGGAAPMSAPAGLQFVIDFQPGSGLSQFEKFGRQAYWPSGSSGSHDFTDENSPEFADFVQLVTNGYDDDISLLTWNDFYGGSGALGPESAWGLGQPDLAGNHIDSIRLVVHDLTIAPYNPGEPFGEGLAWNGHITWEFWGTPVPEPPSVLLLLFVGPLLSRRCRSLTTI